MKLSSQERSTAKCLQDTSEFLGFICGIFGGIGISMGRGHNRYCVSLLLKLSPRWFELGSEAGNKAAFPLRFISLRLLLIIFSFLLLVCPQETHQQLANEKNLYVVEFREEQGPLPIVVALPEGTVREDPEPEDDVPDTKLEWSEVKEAQGMKKSPWTNVRQRVWWKIQYIFPCCSEMQL